MRTHRYALWAKGPGPETSKCGEFVIREANSHRIQHVAFRYTDNYLNKAWAYPLDPGQLPLSSDTFNFETTGKNLPGFIDDIMPDRWGTDVLVRHLRSKDSIEFDPNSRFQILNHLPESVVGSLRVTPATEEQEHPPSLCSLGLPLELLNEIGDPEVVLKSMGSGDPHSRCMARLAKGCGVGGARPKVLCFDEANAYIAKFRRSDDAFNMVRVEAACLEMIRKAGFSAAEAHVQDRGDGQEALMIRRFDTAPTDQRFHIMTANALLKQQSSCEDAIFPDYTDIVDLIQRYSVTPEADLKQLFAQVLFNQHLNNRDDHLRNFSFLNGQGGFRLAPAYDVVPSVVAGAYPALGYRGGTRLPECDTAADAAKSFHLSRNDATRIAHSVKETVSQWREIMLAHGIKQQDLRTLNHVFG